MERSRAVDVDILGLLSKLGHYAEDAYVPDSNPIRTLKAIRRLLNKDTKEDEDFGLESLAEVRSIRNHLMPLMLATSDTELCGDVIDEITKLLVLLTWPGTKWAEGHANELRLALYEESTAGFDPLLLLASRVESALETDASKRSEEDRKRVDLLLYLTRNLLYPTPEQVAQEECLLELDKANFLDMILHFTRHVTRKNNREWNLLLLEILFYIFIGVSPEDLVSLSSDGKSSQTGEKIMNTSNLVKSALSNTMQELNRKGTSRMKALPSRHSHFGGVLVLEGDGERKPLSSIFASNDVRRAEDSALPKSIAQRKRRVHDTSVVSGDILASRNYGIVSLKVKQCLRRVADELVDQSYAALFSTIIQDFRREDTRIKPEDEVRFIWMVRFFTRYVRLRKNWFKTSVMTTMDLWSFQFVINRMNDHLEQKAWASLETSVGALLEMMRNLQEIKTEEGGKSLKNAVFYELRERLEIIPRLLKIWDPASMSRDYLKSLVVLADLILNTLEDMAEEGAMAKARSKAMRRTERQQKAKGVFNLSWSAEETFALAAGVKERGGEYDLNVMRSILKDPGLGSTFEDQKRTPQQLLARWMQVREALANGKTLDQFVKEDQEKQEEEDEKEEAEAAKTEQPEVSEKQVDFFAALRSYLSNNIFRNFSRLVDPACHSQGEGALLRDTESQRLVAKFYRRLRGFKKGIRPDDSLEPLLWHVENFDTWRRYLQLIVQCKASDLSSESNDLTSVIRSSLRRFFRLSQTNKLIFIESLFWRTKQDNVLISRLYGRFAVQKKQAVALADEDMLKDNEEEMAELDQRVEDDEEEIDDNHADEDDEDYSSDERASDDEKKVTKVKKVEVADSKPEATKSSKKVIERPRRKPKEETNKEKKRKGPRSSGLTMRFSLDSRALSSAVRQALRAGVTSEAFMCLVQAFEAMDGAALDIAFVPFGLSETDHSFEKAEMHRVMLCLGMRPPNRSLTTKKRVSFSAEAYWRILGSRLNVSQCNACAEALREAVMGSVGDDTEENGEMLEKTLDISWCISSDEEADGTEEAVHQDDEDSANEGSDVQEHSSFEVDAEETQQDEEPKVNKSRLRRVVSSDEEDGSEEMEEPLETVDEMKPSMEENVAAAESTQSTQKRRRVVSSDDED